MPSVFIPRLYSIWCCRHSIRNTSAEVDYIYFFIACSDFPIITHRRIRFLALLKIIVSSVMAPGQRTKWREGNLAIFSFLQSWEEDEQARTLTAATRKVGCSGISVSSDCSGKERKENEGRKFACKTGHPFVIMKSQLCPDRHTWVVSR